MTGLSLQRRSKNLNQQNTQKETQKVDQVLIIQSGPDLSEAIKKGLSTINNLDFPKIPILIKPNICTEQDNRNAANTDISVISALIYTILGCNSDATIKIIESDSGDKNVETAFYSEGYIHLVRKFQEDGYDVQLINLSKEKKF